MSILSTVYPSFIEKDPYTLAISQNRASILIKMSMATAHFHTNHFPSTFAILEEYLPGVLKTKCFNKNNYSFDREVLNTEIGHLFEHMILEVLCELKLEKGHKSAVFRGLTQWDWKKDEKGTFNITLYADTADWDLFPKALEKAEMILAKILASPIRFSEAN